MNETILQVLWTQTLAGTALLIILLSLRALFGKKLKARFVCIAWLVVALRFILPLSLPGPYVPPNPVAPLPFQWAAPAVEAAQQPQETTALTLAEEPALLAPAPLTQAEPQTTIVTQPKRALPVNAVLLGLWGLGVISVLGAMVIANRCFRNAVMKTAQPIETAAFLPVYLTHVAAPCLVGIKNPYILLNPTALKEENLPYVLEHELSHCRHHDNWFRGFALLLCALNWFNPLVWLGAALYKKDCERACDERVTKGYGEEHIQAYARTLIALVTPEKPRLLSLSMPMAVSFKEMKGRIAHVVLKTKPRRVLCGLLSLVLLCATGLSFLTASAVAEAIPMPETFQEAPAFCPSEYGLVLGFDGQIYLEKEEGRLMPVAKVQSPKLIACDTAFIYVYDNQAHSISSFTFQGEAVESKVLKSEIVPVSMAASRDFLAIVTQDGTLYYLDKQGLWQSSPVAKGIHQVVSNGEGHLVLVTPEENPLITFSTIYHEDIGENVYYPSRSKVSFIPLQTHESGQPLAVTCWLSQTDYIENPALQAPVRYKHILYSYNGETRTLEKTTVGDPDQLLLTVVDYFGLHGELERIQTWYEENRPDTALRMLHISVMEKRAAFYNGQFPFDILYESTGILQNGARQRVYKAFNDIPALDSFSLGTAAVYQQTFSFQGKLYACPLSTEAGLFYLDKTWALAIGFTMPQEGYTWKDLYDAAKAAGVGQPGKPILFRESYDGNPMFLRNYCYANTQWYDSVNFDTPAFREMLQVYRQMVSEGMILYGETQGYDPCLFSTAGENSNGYCYPGWEGHAITISQHWGCAISANAPNEQGAVEYILNLLAPKLKTSLKTSNGLPYTETKGDPDRITWSSAFNPATLTQASEKLSFYIDGSLGEDDFIAYLQNWSNERAQLLK